MGKKRNRYQKNIEASKYFLGCHNFSSFRAAGCQAQSPTRTIENIKIIKKKSVIELNFLAKSFLYNQVRIMVGTLKEVATTSRPPGELEQIIKLQNRKYAGITAPPQGLTLKKVFY